MVVVFSVEDLEAGNTLIHDMKGLADGKWLLPPHAVIVPDSTLRVEMGSDLRCIPPEGFLLPAVCVAEEVLYTFLMEVDLVKWLVGALIALIVIVTAMEVVNRILEDRAAPPAVIDQYVGKNSWGHLLSRSRTAGA